MYYLLIINPGDSLLTEICLLFSLLVGEDVRFGVFSLSEMDVCGCIDVLLILQMDFLFELVLVCNFCPKWTLHDKSHSSFGKSAF